MGRAAVTAAEALTHMRDPESLGVRTGAIDCFLLPSGDTIEADNPGGSGTVDLTCDEFLQQFAHNQFRRLTNADFSQ